MSKDPKTELQTAYYQLLNGNVNVGGVIGVYDGIPADAEYPLISIGEYTQTDSSDKSSFGEDTTVTIKIIDRFSSSVISRAKIFAITAAVKGIIRTRPQAITLPSYNVIRTIVDGQHTYRELSATHIYVHEVLRFRHELEQLT